MPPSARAAGTRCDVEVDTAVGAPARYRYMYTPLEERAAALEKGLLSLQVKKNSHARLRREIDSERSYSRLATWYLLLAADHSTDYCRY